MPSLEACRAEIEQHFQFMTRWQSGELDEDAFARQEKVSAPEFKIVGPNGQVIDRDGVISQLYDSKGTMEAPETDIEDVELVKDLGEYALVRYKAVRDGDERSDTIETVLFRDDEDAPGGLVWVDLHETYVES